MTIHIKLPPKLQKYLQQQAQEHDCSVEQYIQEVLVREIERERFESHAPAELSPRSVEDVNQILKQAEGESSSKWTSADWDELYALADSFRKAKKSKTRE